MTEKIQPPFSGKLGRSPFREKISTVEGNPDVLIRISGSEQEELDYHLPLYTPEILERYRVNMRILAELDQKYNIPNSGFQPVVGRDSDERQKIFAITHKIHGEPVEELLEERKKPELPKKVESLLMNMTNYLIDKGMQGGFFHTDLRLSHQFVYGHTQNDLEDRIVLVDIDPMFSTHHPRNLTPDLFNSFVFLSQSLDIAGFLNQDIDIDTPTEKAIDFLKQFENYHPAHMALHRLSVKKPKPISSH